MEMLIYKLPLGLIVIEAPPKLHSE